MDNEDYNAGWNDCEQRRLEEHIPLSQVTESIDKFLDKINDNRKLLRYVFKHFETNLSIMNVPMTKVSEKVKNKTQILKLIKEELEKGKPDGKKRG